MTYFIKQQTALVIHGLACGCLLVTAISQSNYTSVAVIGVCGFCMLAGLRFARKDMIDVVRNALGVKEKDD